MATGGRDRAPAGIDAKTLAAIAMMLLVWGSSAVATRIGMDGYGPGQLALLRFLITSVAMGLYAAVTRMRVPTPRDFLGLVGTGLVGISIPQLTFTFSLQSVDPATATFLFSTIPVVAALLARFVFGERLTAAGWTGIALTVVGTSILVLGQGGGVDFTRGALLLLLGTFCEAVYYILQKPFLSRYTALEVGTWTLIAATLPLLIFLPGLGGQIASATPAQTAAVVYVALGAGAVGYVSFSIINARLPTSVAAVMVAPMPLVTLVFAWWLLGVAPPPLSVLGGLVSIAGVVLVTLRGRASRPATRATAPAPAAAD